MNATVPLVPASQLASRIAERFLASAGGGSRIALESTPEIVEDGGIPFVVRVLSARWGAAAQQAKDSSGASRAANAARPGIGDDEARTSPFLPPYDPALLIGAISPTHVCLLNKYNVLDRHVLIVTRDFEPQESALTTADFDAAAICLEAIDGLLFYNSGAVAGASQSHKHLQLVPFPIGPGGARFPLDRSFAASLAAGLERVPVLGCRHLLSKCEAAAGLATYRRLVSSLDLDRGRRMAPYNLLMTRDWMVVVPRSSGTVARIEVNALGFAGSLVARGDQDLAALRAIGPLELLRRAGVGG